MFPHWVSRNERSAGLHDGQPVAAHADPAPVSDIGRLVAGSGTISPGYPCPTTGSGCTIHINFTGMFAGDDGVSVTVCSFTGHDVGGTAISGSGTFSCDDGTFGSITFSRVGNVVTLSGTVTRGGTTHTIEAGDLELAPLDAASSSFALTGPSYSWTSSR
jgi:hypothetical protein